MTIAQIARYRCVRNSVFPRSALRRRVFHGCVLLMLLAVTVSDPHAVLAQTVFAPEGSRPTGSQLTGSQLTDTQLTGTRLTGVVVDANGGERLARVRVRIDAAEPRERAGARTPREAVTNEKGEFAFDDLPAGEHTLVLETVGYRLHREQAVTSTQHTTQVTIALVADSDALRADALHVRETVTVTTDVFQSPVPSSPSAYRIGTAEIRNLSSVLLDDPVRAMSSLPGVIAADDNRSTFGVRGAPFQQVAMFLDDVPIKAPTHAFGGAIGDGFSLSMLNDQVLNSMTLLSVAPPPAFGGASGAAVVAETRDGQRDKPTFHASISLIDANLLGEGPLTPDKRGTWFVVFRKSDLSYRSKQTGANNKQTVSFTDVQSKVTYDLTPTNTVSVHVLSGSTDYAASPQNLSEEGFVGPNTVTASTGSSDLIKANWRSTPTSTLAVSTTAAYQRMRDEERSQTNEPLASSRYTDVSGQTRVAWFWNANAPLRLGYDMHRTADRGTSSLSLFEDQAFRPLNAYNGQATSQSAFAEQAWSPVSHRLHLTGGIRWQQSNRVDVHLALPFLSTAWALTPRSTLEFGWGQYAQFPDIDMLELAAPGVSLRPYRSTHTVVAFDHRLDAQTRVRVEAYAREDRDVLDAPDIYPRLLDGQVVWPTVVPRWRNAYDGYSRGVQILVQRRSASRLSGWIGYTLGYNRQRDLTTNTWFDSDNDTRHALNAYASYRLTPGINLSGHYNYATGAPIPGYFSLIDPGNVLGSQSQAVIDRRNTSRLPTYQRLDLRLNKSFVFTRWKMTLYADVTNATYHHNYRYMGIVGNYADRAWANIGSAMPTRPAIGLSVDF